MTRRRQRRRRVCRADANERTNERALEVGANRRKRGDFTSRHFHLTFPICVRASRACAITLTDGRAARTTICRPHTPQETAAAYTGIWLSDVKVGILS